MIPLLLFLASTVHFAPVHAKICVPKMDRVREQIQELFEIFLTESHRPGDISSPLVSPWAVKRMAEILGVDIVDEYYQVPNIKTFLKTFLLQYRLEEGINPEEIDSCREMVSHERAKHKQPSESSDPHPYHEEISKMNSAQLYCIECGLVGTRFCVSCKDCFCTECCDRIHAKGNRSLHHVNKIIPCTLCRTRPSRLQCTYSFNTFCTECYSSKHVKTIPTNMLDLRPVRIDYTLGFNTKSPGKGRMSLGEELAGSMGAGAPIAMHSLKNSRLLAIGEPDSQIELDASSSFTAPTTASLPHDWHPFLDSSGVRYYYNFKTQESMRRAGPGVIPDPTIEEVKRSRTENAIRKIIFDSGATVLK